MKWYLFLVFPLLIVLMVKPVIQKNLSAIGQFKTDMVVAVDPCVIYQNETKIYQSLQGDRLNGLLTYCQNRTEFLKGNVSLVNKTPDCDLAVWFWREAQQVPALSTELDFMENLYALCPIKPISTQYSIALRERALITQDDAELKALSVSLLHLPFVAIEAYGALIESNLAMNNLSMATELGKIAHEKYAGNSRIEYLYGLTLVKNGDFIDGYRLLCLAYKHSPNPENSKAYLQTAQDLSDSMNICDNNE
jgi:hypothetical protein